MVIIILAIILLPILWYLVSPLFIDKMVSEEDPFAGRQLDIVDMGEKSSSSVSTLEEGTFMDADSFHKTSGNVRVISDGENSFLRFENFEATNGPDLYVYLATDTGAEDYVNLGRLKGNVGNQNYELPSDVDLGKYDNVLIWCEQFSVLFGSAELN